MSNVKSIGELIKAIDKECKEDLDNNLINGERDYLSCFSVLIRKNNWFNEPTIPCISYTLSSRAERKFGADNALILIKKKSKGKTNDELFAKVILIEGKLIDNTNNWDYKLNEYKDKTKPKRYSHFLEQLDRQIKYKGLVFLEMFMHKFKKQQKYDKNDLIYPKNISGSDFILLDNIIPWRSKIGNVNKLDFKHYVELIQYSENINNLINSIMKCNYGYPFPLDENSKNITLEVNIENNKTDVISFPIPQEFTAQKSNNNKNHYYPSDAFISEMEICMRKYGFRTYSVAFMDNDEIKKRF